MMNRWLCVIDVKNEQEDYAQATQMIQAIERLESSITAEGPDDMFGFRILRMHNLDSDTTAARQIMPVEHILMGNHASQVSRISTWRQLSNGLKKSGGEHQFSYYIRVDLSGKSSDLPTLRYLLLLIQSCPSIDKKLTVFLRDAGSPPLELLKQNELYFKLSHFLRFVQSRHQVFFGEYNHEICSLGTQHPGTHQTFVPLLEIDEETYSALSRTWLLRSDFQPGRRFSDLYKALVPACEKRDAYTHALFQIGARFLFRSINGNRYRTDEKKRRLLSIITEVVGEFKGISPLDMLLFGALMDEDMYNGIDHEQLRHYLLEIKSFSYAVIQILENICRHSEYQRGAFTMRLQTTPEYIQKNYPGYSIGEKEYALEILIADGNRRDGILSHFLSTYKATPDLQANKDLIHLADFFQENPQSDAASLWEKARAERPGSCHGLLSFSTAVHHFGGAFLVRSDPSFTGIGEQSYYYQSISGANSASAVHDYTHWFPGTQFSAVFKRTAFHKSLESQRADSQQSILDTPHIIYSTTYQDLALALRFKRKLLSLFPGEETVDQLSEKFIKRCEGLQGQQCKDNLAESWKSWFDQQAGRRKQSANDEREHFLFYVELNNFGTGQERFPGEIEAFCKGFFSSVFFQKPADGGNLRYIILFTGLSPRMGVVFYQTLSVLFRRIYTRMTYVYFYQADQSNQAAPYFFTTLQEALHRIDHSYPKELPEFPRTFPYLLLMEKDGAGSVFEYEMARQAAISILDPEQQGYMIDETHMRLGNKVHLDSFFEMALFFENPNYAYYTAFLILRRIIDQPDLKQKLQNASHILFYGYSSYSRSVVWAAMQIWQAYIALEQLKFPEEIEFAIYQNDLKLESDHPNVQMYYSQKDWQKDPQKIWEPKDTTLIQIVPISSSLTTFNKMLAELRDESGKTFEPLANLTALWVRDDYKKKLKEADWNSKPTDEEKPFWDKADLKEKWVESKLLGIKVQYLVNVTGYWRNPLKCEKCFPTDPVLEFPLVETDPTSTVPTQQFYLKSDVPARERPKEAETENDERVAKIRGNLLYGHIVRGHNHFQFYLQTRQYFQQERESIKDWLKDLSRCAESENSGLVGEKVSGRHIDVLVVPKQTSNVEFSQYVYEYYFNSGAESIVVNTEKEFRSNFMAEYNGLALRLKREQMHGCDIQLHYIDTAIDSGLTFQRATALINSLFERHGIQHTSGQNMIFENVFLLISRMSYASKQTYVRRPDGHFHAYVELYISNMRSFGDSCVPCKLQQEARRYYQNAATKSISAYWEKKSIHRSSTLFDDAQLRNESSDESYCRMACTHKATYYLSQARGKDISDYFGALRAFFSELQRASAGQADVSPIYQQLREGKETSLEWFSAALKIMARPFFSFDYKLRCVVMDFYLLLSEYLLRPESGGPDVELLKKEKPYLLEDGILDWVKGFAENLKNALNNEYGPRESDYRRLSFIQAHLLKGLTDLKSNYVLRLCTICAVFSQVSKANLTLEEQEKILRHYLRSILRLVNNSSDEAKSVWLEHLLQTHYEYPKTVQERISGKTLENQIPQNMLPLLRHFLEVLLVENNRPLFQGVQDLAHTLEHDTDICLDDVLNASHMRNVRQFLDMSRDSWTSTTQAAKAELMPLVELYQMLKSPEQSRASADSGPDASPLKRYDDLRKALQKIALETTKGGQVLLFGPQRLKSPYPHSSAYYMISPQPSIDYSRQEQVEKDLNRLGGRLLDHEMELNEEGFCLIKSEPDPTKYDICLKLDNNYDEIKKRESKNGPNPDDERELVSGDGQRVQKIQPVYIFFPCGADRKKALMLVRKVLMFRCRLISWLEQDFNNHAIPALIQQRYWAETLAAEKVGDHAEQDFVECTRRVLSEENCDFGFTSEMVDESGQEQTLWEPVEDGGIPSGLPEEKLAGLRHWYLMRAYVNLRISRLYRTHAQERSHLGNPFTPEETARRMEQYYKQRLQKVGMDPAYSLRNIFFPQIESGSTRRGYLEQIMKVVAFKVDGKADFCKGGSMESRQNVLEETWRGYRFVQFQKDGTHYMYRSEYLAVIFLDCCVSALKAGEAWKNYSSGYEVFLNLCDKPAEQKCEIRISRESGEGDFDYLVIENDVYPSDGHSHKSGPGMSQTAICWYIETLWEFVSDGNAAYPKVIIPPDSGGKLYQIKLPILKKNEGGSVSI